MDPQPPPNPSPEPPFIDITSEPSTGQFSSGQHSAMDRMLKRRRNVFFGILLLLALGAALWLWTQPDQYEATATVLLTRIGPDASPVTESELASEIQIVWAQTQMLADLTRGPGAVSESIQSAERRRTDLRAHIAVKQQAKSQVIAVSYTDLSAKIATDQANRLTDLYLQHRRSLFGSPNHLIAVEAESITLSGQADEATKKLAAFDAKAKGAASPDSFRIKSQRLANLEDRTFELKASLRGQEEVLRVLRKQQSAEVLRAEAQLAGMRAKLQEMEKEYARIERLETQAGSLIAKREELVRRAALARERAESLARRFQDSQIAGMNLQASKLTRAEAAPVRIIDLEWWQIFAIMVGILAIASIGAWAVETFDRPVYSDDEFARMTGAPKVRTTTD